jgi:hypothetical protein
MRDDTVRAGALTTPCGRDGVRVELTPCLTQGGYMIDINAEFGHISASVHG